MTVDIARAAVIAGDGIVARYPGVLCVARCPDRDALARLLDVCAGAAGPDPGRVLARRLAQWMGGPDAPGDDMEFGTVAIAGDQLGTFLVGAVAVVVPGSPLALSGADAATWTDRLIPLPEVPVVLALDGLVPPAGMSHDINDLRAGVVPGAGAVLFPVGRSATVRPEPDGGVDSPTVRTPAQAPRAVPRNGAHRGGASPNGTSRRPANGSPTIGSDGDAAVEGPRGRRQGSHAPDARNGHEWFSDRSDGGAPDGAASTTWPWADPPAEPTRPDAPADPGPYTGLPNAADAQPVSGPAREPVAQDPAAHDPAAYDPAAPERTGPTPPAPVQPPVVQQVVGDPFPVDEPDADRRNGHGRAAEAATPPGGSPQVPVWIDPSDAARFDPHIEGRHAILGTDGIPDPDPSGGVPIEQPGIEHSEVEQYDVGPVHPLAADPVRAAAGAGAAPEQIVPAALPDDDTTPVTAAAAVTREPASTGDGPEPGGTSDAAEVVAPGPNPRPPTPGPRPPAPAEPAEIAEPDPDEPLVHGRLCEEGHLNDPRSSSCLRCGAPVEGGAGVVGPRPALGRIVFDDGAAFTVDAEYLVGRMPEADPRARSGELQPIVVEDRSGSVSRVHAEILINGWDVVLVDSGSRNGTFVAAPDEEGWTPLAPGRTSLLLPGTRVRMGGRTFVFEPPVPVG